MKKISIFICLSMFIIFSCKKDENMVLLKSDVAPAQISSPTAGSVITITGDMLTASMQFAWSPTGYGVATQVSYNLEVDTKCGTFAAPVILGTSNATNFSLTYADLNSKLISNLKLAPHVETDIQVRITSTINDKYLAISDIVTMKVTPYSDAPVALWMGENNANAPILYSVSDSLYEGYRYVTAGTSFHLVNSRACPDVYYGASGTAGVLASGSASAMITMPNAGYYKFNVDTKNHTFDTLLIYTWGMIGSATPGAWDTSSPMTYDPDKDVWTGDIELTNGALKFRANNWWDVNYGPKVIDDLEGTLIGTNDAINIAEPAKYTVTIDFSQSASPYQYRYSVKKSLNIPEPTKLWLPGGYQSYSPSTAPTIYAINATVFEGYVYINAGTGFKFTSAPDWGHINYGDSGTPGVLSTDGLAPDLGLSQAGYYKFRVDIQNLTYDIQLVNTWGMIGTATPGIWDVSSPLTYDQANDVWTGTLDLAVGALKFRANDGWGLNYGPAVITDLEGQLVTTDNSINIAEAGNYTVTLDFSRSVVPYKYTYKVIKN